MLTRSALTNVVSLLLLSVTTAGYSEPPPFTEPPNAAIVQPLAVCDPPLADTDGDGICDADDLDDDNDGLPDSFEQANGLQVLQGGDGLGDLDGDGFSNLAEFRAGTDPSTLNSVPTSDVSSTLVSSVLPLSRSAQVGTTVTAFATILNSGTDAVSNCSLAPNTPLDAGFFFNSADPATNAIVGETNAGTDIAAGASASFVFGFTPTDAIDPVDVSIRFGCDGVAPVSVLPGINTFALSASIDPVPDVVALAATASLDGVLRIADVAAPGAFAVASINLGVGGDITVTAVSAGDPLPLTLSLCETDATGQCINPTVPAASVTTTVASNATPTFSIFASASEAIAFAPGNNRIAVEFSDDTGVLRGSTGVAIEALDDSAAGPVGPSFTEVQAIFSANCLPCHAGPSPAAQQSLAEGEAFSNIVSVNSVQDSSLFRIEPNEPDDSYLVRKLEGGPNILGSQMPLGGPPLPQSTIDLIRDWVEAGALDN